MAKRHHSAMGHNPKKGHVMEPNDRGAKHWEEMSRPCGLPMGAHQQEMGNGEYFSMNAYRVGDLFEQVDKSMREDSAAIKSMTKPTNW